MSENEEGNHPCRVKVGHDVDGNGLLPRKYVSKRVALSNVEK